MGTEVSDPLRPASFADFVGQKPLVDALQTLITGAQNRGALPHNMLIEGPAGTGKTTLALIIAEQFPTKWGPQVVSFIGPQVRRTEDVMLSVWGALPNTVLFIDEIHRMYRPVQEYLFPIMEDGVVVDAGARYKLPPLLWVGATTDPERLLTPYLDRFTILRLGDYSTDEMATIATRAATRLGCALADDAAQSIAKAAEGTPRVALKIMTTARDYAYAEAGVQAEVATGVVKPTVTITDTAVRAVLDSTAFVWRQTGRNASDR